ncbi:hypothetical protein D3C71_1616920 [compost metagenome]
MREPNKSRAILAIAMTIWVVKVVGSNANGYGFGVVSPMMRLSDGTAIAAPRQPSRQVRAMAGSAISNCRLVLTVADSAGISTEAMPVRIINASAAILGVRKRPVHVSSVRRLAQSRASGTTVRMPMKSPTM